MPVQGGGGGENTRDRSVPDGSDNETNHELTIVMNAQTVLFSEKYLPRGEIWIPFGECVLFIETVFHFGMIHKEYGDKQQTMLIFDVCTNMPLRQIFLE